MLLAILIAETLLGSPEHDRRPVRGGLYDTGGCERLEGWNVLPPFEEVSGEALGDTMEFKCALALYLDSPDATDGQKFEHLAKQALRGENWAAALSQPMARLDFERYQDFIVRHAKALQPAAWYEACLILVGPGPGGEPGRGGSERSHSTKLLRPFYDQAFQSPSPKVRDCMTARFNNSAITEAQARAFAGRLSVEETPSVRAELLNLQLWVNSPRTNRVILDFLRGPVEYEVLHHLCRSFWSEGSTFVKASRYDFLPDLKGLRARLPDAIAGETDVRRKHQVKKDAEKAMEDLDVLIAALEKKRAQDELDAETKGDAGRPTGLLK